MRSQVDKNVTTVQSERTARCMKMRTSDMPRRGVGLLLHLRIYETRSMNGANWLQHPQL